MKEKRSTKITDQQRKKERKKEREDPKVRMKEMSVNERQLRFVSGG